MIKKDLKNKRITVVGLGLHGGGVGTVRFLAECGAKVLVTDIKQREELRPSLDKLKGVSATYVLGQHRPEDFTETDLIVRSPAVPDNFKYFELARAKKIPITNDIALFFKLCPGRICGVTGTKGKSTTAQLLALMLEKTAPVVLAGNIGVSALESLSQVKADTLVVLELSSWQLEDLAAAGLSPGVAVITNITADHLDRHVTPEKYLEAKATILKHQHAKDLAILNYDDPPTQGLGASAPGQVWYFSVKHDLNAIIAAQSRYQVGASVKVQAVIFGRAGEILLNTNEITLKGQHNLANVLAATTAARLLGASAKRIAKVANSFKGLPGRLESVAVWREIGFYNDTTATNPTAAAAALEALDPAGERQVALIVGGQNKNLPLEPLPAAIAKYCNFVAILPGTFSDLLFEELQKQRVTPHQMVLSLEEAITQCASHSKAGGAIVLSPGAASFNMFRHEFDRGDQYAAAVKKFISLNP